MNLVKWIFIVVLLFIASFVNAQDHDELDPVTVSASISPVPVSRTGRNVTVVSGESYSVLPVMSVDEFIKYLPGIEVQMRGPGGSQADIVIRGGTFQQVLVILDGIRINDPNTGHFSAYIPVTPSEIDRIEILKGASSALYGSEAVGGVVHIITKAFAAQQNSEIQTLSAGMKIGEYGLRNLYAGGTYKKEKSVFNIGVQNNHSNGQLQRGTRGYFDNSILSATYRQFFKSNFDIAIRAGCDSRDFSAQNYYTSFLSDTADESVLSYWTQFKLNKSFSSHKITIDAGYKHLQDRFLFNPSSRRNESESEMLQLGITDNFFAGKNSVLVTGIQYNKRSIASNDRGHHNRNQWAAFAMFNQHWKRFAVSPAIRVDDYEGRGTEVVPQINLSFHHEQLQIRASAGKTIRDADFTERFNNYNNPLVTGGSIGNPDLLAERSFSYEAGADYRISRAVKISLSAFQRRMKQLIDYVPTPYEDMPRKDNLSPTGSFALAKNIGRVVTSGWEADLQFKRDPLTAAIGLLWLKSDAGDEDLSFYLSSHSRFLANMHVSYQFKRLYFSFTSVYKNRAPLEAPAIHAIIPEHSFLANMKLGYRFAGEKIRIHLQADNIFNTEVSDLLGARLPGRWISGGMDFKLGS